MIKKLRYILKNYYNLNYLITHIKEITFLVENYDLITTLYEDVYELKEKVKEFSEKPSKDKKKYSIAGVPKGQKEYVLGLMEETGDSVLDKKLNKRGDK